MDSKKKATFFKCIYCKNYKIINSSYIRRKGKLSKNPIYYKSCHRCRRKHKLYDEGYKSTKITSSIRKKNKKNPLLLKFYN